MQVTCQVAIAGAAACHYLTMVDVGTLNGTALHVIAYHITIVIEFTEVLVEFGHFDSTAIVARLIAFASNQIAVDIGSVGHIDRACTADFTTRQHNQTSLINHVQRTIDNQLTTITDDNHTIDTHGRAIY